MSLSFLLLLAASHAMPGDAFEVLRRQVDDASFADDRLAVLRTAAATGTFSPSQAAALLEAIPFADEQLAALRILAPRLEAGPRDPILESFSFSSDREQASRILAAHPAAAAPALQAAAAGRTPGPPRIGCPRGADLPALEVNWSSAWTDAEVDALVRELEAVPFSDDRLARLARRVRARPEGFTGGQVVRLLGAFDFSSDLERVIATVDDHLLGMTVAEVRGILDAYTFSDGKLAALAVLKDTITDVEHAHRLLDAFSFSSDRVRAAEILEDLTPRSFVYGTVHSQNVVFVVDTSGSMEATFRTNQGRTLSRLDFVRCELDTVLVDQLLPTARFDVVAFSDRADAWSPSLVVARPDRVAAAREYVANLRPAGATNLHDALEVAFGMRPDTIYVLTDGAPTAGALRRPEDLTAAVARWAGDTVTVYTIAFLTGSHPGDDKPTSRALMRAIAEATGGVYRAIE